MKRVAHVSDLHFGREDPEAVIAILKDLREQKPDLVAVSGDLTQRARRREFRSARVFLDALPAPWIAVPGNHDVPLYDLLRRTFQPWSRYRQFIAPDLDPWFAGEGLAVLGLNSARRGVRSQGRLSLRQIGLIRKRFARLDAERSRLLITHHPFVPIEGSPHRSLLGRAPLALRALATARVDLLLAGHHHLDYSGDVRAHHTSIERSMIVAHAGTAVSLRERGEANAYNMLHLRPDHVELSVRRYDGRIFRPHGTTRYHRRDDAWIRTTAPVTLPTPAKAGPWSPAATTPAAG